jgi:RNase H-fold protein (predicted Holliday junction resolvase)
VRVEISEQQSGLEEHETGDPDGGRPAERGQQLFGRHGLDGEEQKSSEKNRSAVKDSHRTKDQSDPLETLPCGSPRQFLRLGFPRKPAPSLRRKLKVMRIGIDFGTTRVVVASVDRGNFPLVNFEKPDGQACDWFPPVVAVKGDTRLYGWQAIAAQEDDSWTIMRSLKRCLRSAGLHTELHAGGQALPLRLLLAEMMTALRIQLLEHSNLRAQPNEPLEVVLGVPANANSNQRFLTEEAAQSAGFSVLGLMNEPSAAAIEYAWRDGASAAAALAAGCWCMTWVAAPSMFLS